jgi:Protein of unknown function (DUF559)
MNPKNPGSKIHQVARVLRRNRTTAEAKLWACLREGQQGCQFRRQFPTGEFTVDFCCRERRKAAAYQYTPAPGRNGRGEAEAAAIRMAGAEDTHPRRRGWFGAGAGAW